MNKEKHILNTVTKAALKAGDLVQKLYKKGIGQELRINKSDGTYSIIADIKSEKLIIDYLKKNIPFEFAILSEESGGEQKKNIYTIVIDPIDGTYNYSRGLHEYAISIGVARNGIPVGGVVYLPEYKKLFTAWKNKGAYCNAKKITFNPQWPYQRVIVDGLAKTFPSKVMHKINTQFKWMRSGCVVPAMMHVASSRMDGCILMGAYPWDYCAGIIILQEAGAIVTDDKGKPPTLKSKIIIAGKKDIAKKLQKVLK